MRTVVLAGGSGTRFWPLGRASRPKQVLALDGDDRRPLVVATVDRVRPLSGKPPLLVAPAALTRTLRRLLPRLPRASFVEEPSPRNTAAAVILAALTLREREPSATMLVVPADHHVAPLGRYRAALRTMASRARSAGTLLTLGLRPTFPATGYGWLRVGARVPGTGRSPGGSSIRRVERYREKPPLAVAKRLLRDGRHLWNGGSFAFRVDTFLAQAGSILPDVTSPLAEAFDRRGRARSRALEAAYARIPSVSLDHGVMEAARDVEVVAADLDWDDLGSFDAVARHRAPDAAGNRVHGSATLVDAEGCVVEAEAGHVALLGVRDLVVVRTADAVLVARRGHGEDVRRVVARLEEAGRKDLLA